ncbi:MAG: hypothetical protein K5821_07620 [Nitrobacter sp.]|nr:hypothetical protein [Nitrobacter sp.]
MHQDNPHTLAGLLAKRYGYARPGLERQPWGATTMTVTDLFYNCLVFSEERRR